MRVLSLFDWIACGYEALKRAWIQVDKYYASEIDKYAIQIATKNHPDIIQLGDVNDRQWWWLEPWDIDLLIGGSPCQGFSIAWKMLNFNDPRSALFFKFVDILQHLKPKYFLLENVKMKKEFRDKISELIGVEPILIDSAKVSAQHRERYYRTNIPNVEQPEDRWIMLKDIIIQEPVEEKYYLTEAQLKTIQRNFWAKGKILNDTESLIEKMTFPSRIKQIEGLGIKTPTLPAAMGTWWGNVPVIVIQKVGDRDKNNRGVHTDKSYCIPANPMSDRWQVVAIAYAPWSREYEQQWWKTEKSPTLAARDYKDPKIIFNGRKLRKLTPIECERLQTLPDDYTAGVSNTQRYKALGNGRTVEVIAHIFSYITKG